MTAKITETTANPATRAPEIPGYRVVKVMHGSQTDLTPVDLGWLRAVGSHNQVGDLRMYRYVKAGDGKYDCHLYETTGPTISATARNTDRIHALLYHPSTTRYLCGAVRDDSTGTFEPILTTEAGNLFDGSLEMAAKHMAERTDGRVCDGCLRIVTDEARAEAEKMAALRAEQHSRLTQPRRVIGRPTDAKGRGTDLDGDAYRDEIRRSIDDYPSIEYDNNGRAVDVR